MTLKGRLYIKKVLDWNSYDYRLDFFENVLFSGFDLNNYKTFKEPCLKILNKPIEIKLNVCIFGCLNFSK